MKPRLFASFVLAVSLALLMAASTAAQRPFVSADDVSPQQVNVPAVSLGQPGTSFRYVQTFGVTETPYFSDTTHLNQPRGLFIDGNGNLYIAEEQGCRLLKYTSTGTNTLAIGQAGVCYTDDYIFNRPQDVALDGNGNIWVADGNRVVQYTPSGVISQSLPARNNNPSGSGSSNTRFNRVRGIAFDSAGRMFVSDSNNHRVQIYDMASGSPVYSTTIGTTKIPGSGSNQFNTPYHIAVDGSDQLYVADYGNDRVQRCTFSASWSCTTLDGALNNPRGISVDSSNNIYIADTDNGRIRKCASGGICGDWITNTFWLDDVAVDSNGNVYGLESYHTIVVKYNSSGSLVGTFLGVYLVPYLTDNYHYLQPRVAIDSSDNVIILEEKGQRLTKLDSNGIPLWSFGVPGIGSGKDNTHLNWPHGVAVDKSGTIYVADNSRVQIFGSNGTYSATLGTGSGIGNYQFGWAAGIAVDDNKNIYVSDCNNHRVQIYDSSRTYSATLGVTGVSGFDNSHFNCPIGIEVDSAGSIYVADINNCRVQKFNSNRAYQMTFGITGGCGTSHSEVSAEDVAVDAQGRVYVSGWNDRVQVFDSNGAYLTTIGGAWGSNTNQFRGAAGVDVDSQGNVYVSDFENARVQKFAPGVPGWRQANINGFGDPKSERVLTFKVFNNQLYAGTVNYSSGGQIWRTTDGYTWTATSEAGLGTAYTNTNPIISDMIEFNGQLYTTAGSWTSDGVPGQIWRSPDGVTWSLVEGNGFGNINNIHISRLSIFSNTLYAATRSSTGGLEIWRSNTGNTGDWTRVVTGGNGDVDNYTCASFVEFSDYLYASVENTVDGTEIWRTNDGIAWTRVITGGFGDVQNKDPGNLAIWNNYLYVGTSNAANGAQLWRSSDGITWTQVISNGLGNASNTKINPITVFDDALYAGVYNSVTGVKVWRSSDGTTWSQVNPDGFGDSNNVSTSGTAVFNGRFFIGTRNTANGGEVWQMLKQVYLPIVIRN
jgi:hypothetical protein